MAREDLKLEECLVGDESGRILFTARNGLLSNIVILYIYINVSLLLYLYLEQCDQVQVGKTIEIRNARIKLHHGYMRLIVDKWGLIESDPDRSEVREEDIPDMNFSDIQYEDH